MNYNNLEIADLFLMLGEKLKNSPLTGDNLSLKFDVDMLTPQEVCAIYPCFNDGTLRDATKNQLPYYKIGKHRFYRAKDIDAWLEKQIIIEEN